MSNMSKGVSGLLSKLDATLNKNRKKDANNYKEISELRKKSLTKCKEGKNQFVFIIPEGMDDPFFVWGYHNNLLEKEFYSIPCDKHNKNGECLICNIVESLQKDDFVGNQHIWKPIQLKEEFYAPVIDVTSDSTTNEGPKWLKLSTTVMKQVYEWTKNLEADEVEFYDENEPSRIIINYDKTVAPKDQYKLDKKNARAFSPRQLEEWKKMINPIDSFMLSKSQEELKKIVDEYFARIEDLASTDQTGSSREEKEQVEDKSSNSSAVSKLDILKGKK